MMGTLSLLLLDFDGVILESVGLKTRAYAELFRDHPDQLPAILDYHRRNLEVSRYVKFRHIYRELFQQPLSEAEEARLAARFQALTESGMATVPFVPGARELLDRLRGRVPMRIVSGTPQADLETTIAARGLTGYFAGIHGSPPGKTERFRQLLAETGLRPDECLMVGDAPGDYRAAVAAGIPFVGRIGPDEPAEFPAAGTRLIVRDLAELDRWLLTTGAVRP